MIYFLCFNFKEGKKKTQLQKQLEVPLWQCVILVQKKSVICIPLNC